MTSDEPNHLFVDSEIRRLGDSARNSKNWPSAAFFYRKLLDIQPNNTALWLHHGSMLKEAGLFSSARQSFERAANLRPTDLEPVLELAILAKIQGDFRGALSYYTHCLSLNGIDPTIIRNELNSLRRSAPPVNAAEDGEPIFYLSSVSTPAPDDNPVQLKQYLGAANYSYGYAMRGYKDALEELGFKCRLIRNPEYMPDIRSRSATQAVHIGFYPPDAPRFLKGAYNIISIAWEFERLRTRAEAGSYHAFSDPASMLSRAQEVWATSEFGAEAVRRAGITQVRAVPTPVATNRKTGRKARPALAKLQEIAVARLDRVQWVPLAVVPAMQSKMSSYALNKQRSLLDWLIDIDEEQSPIIFISIFNVHDFRKQIKPLLESFVRFSQSNRNAYLLLKVSCIDSDKLDINTMMLMEQVSDAGEMTPPLVSERVLMTTDALSRDEMNALNDMAAYYVCTSHAEGQNLPLIEAMGCGVVPLSVNHTAMNDYIAASNAIIIASQLLPLTPRLTLRYGIYGVSTYYVSAKAISTALARAMDQSDTEYAAMSIAALDRVVECFSSATLLTAVEQGFRRAGIDLSAVQK